MTTTTTYARAYATRNDYTTGAATRTAYKDVAAAALPIGALLTGKGPQKAA